MADLENKEVMTEEIEATNELDNTNYEVAAEPENTGLSTGDKVAIGTAAGCVLYTAAKVVKWAFVGSKGAEPKEAAVKRAWNWTMRKIGKKDKKDKEPEVAEGEVVTEEK